MNRLLLIACLCMLWCGAAVSRAAEPAKRDTVQYYYKPKGLFHVRARTDVSGTGLSLMGKGDDYIGVNVRSDARFKQNLGFGIGPVFLNAGISLGPKQKNLDGDIAINVYGNYLCFYAGYSYATSLYGTGSLLEGNAVNIPAGSMFYHSLQARLIFALNGKRFSFPAAMNQNFIQKRSAGSFLLYVNAVGLNARNKDNDLWTLPDVSVYNGSLGIGAGYGYNWVPFENFLVHLSLLAAPGLLQDTETKVGGVDRNYKASPTASLTGNFSCTWHFAKRFYAGAFASFEDIFTLGNDKDYVVRRGKSDAHLTLGVRF